MEDGLISCACGCGARISRKGANGKPRRFLRGHQTKGRKYPRDDTYWKTRLARIETRLGSCQCGCGEKLEISLGWLKAEGCGGPVVLPRFKDGHMPQIPCGCGCGSLIPAFDKKHQPRTYVPEHAGLAATRRTVDWEARAREWNAKAPLCGCGCGERLVRSAKQLKNHQVGQRFLPGHHGRRSRLTSFTGEELALIYGTLLGDMSIGRPHAKASPRLSFTHSWRQRDYARHKTRSLHRLSWSLSPKVKNAGYGDYSIRGSSSCLKALEEVWEVVRSEGPKRVSHAWLERMDKVSLAYWYMDDGSTSRNVEGVITHGALHTEGFSKGENHLLREWLGDSFGVGSSVRETRGYPYLYLKRSCVLDLLGIITPHLHRSMSYKGLS